MKKHLGFGVGGAAACGIAIAATAHAQPPVSMQTECKSTRCTYDSRDNLIGMPWPFELLVREISGTRYQISYVMSGLDVGTNPIFFYASSNCSGQPYLTDIGQLPRPAWYDALY